MKKIILLSTLILGSLYLTSCITRTETDIYTISEIDTTRVYHIRNAPENDDRGVVFPSSKVIEHQRNLVQYDSIVERYYPNFIRLGLFESVGIFGGSSEHSIGTGILGVYPEFGDLDQKFRGEDGKLVPGGIYRLGIVEKRLRWFRDSPNWTIGTHAIEAILPDARLEKGFVSFAPLYLRKRWYFREDIPYLSAVAAFGLGYTPSQYINLSGAIELGSIGGLNLRAYVGFATGLNLESNLLMADNEFAEGNTFNTIPYAGLGISVLDFHNRVPETLKEWKDHDHSSWDIGLFQMGLISTTAEKSAFESENGEEIPIFSGWFMKIANAKIALPIFNYKVYAGTSLINLFVLGENKWGMSVLPIRLGYWQTVIQDELTIEPFAEFNYFPTNYFQIGTRLNLRITEMFNLSLEGGYINGGNDDLTNLFLQNSYGINTQYSDFYFGLSINLLDRIFYPEHLRYNKK